MDRHQVIQIRVSPEEKATLEGLAREEGVALSQFVRSVALEGASKVGLEQASERFERLDEAGMSEPSFTEEELRAKAMELVRTKGLSYKAARAQVERS